MTSLADERLNRVFRQARPGLVGLCRRVVDGDAEDVVQEAFLKLNADPVLQRPEPEVTAWLRRVSLHLAFNRSRDLKRWHQRAERGGVEIETAAEDPADTAVRHDQRSAVRAVLAELPTKQRDCLLLRHSGYSYAEIAVTLEIAPGSVGTTLARAERAFRALYEDSHAGGEER